MYVEVRGIQQDPATTETLVDEITVNSEADITGVRVTLKETGANTDVFRSVGDPLYLWAASADVASGNHFIKVVDEENLTFSFRTVQAGVSREVMVDRGEYAGCFLEIWFSEANVLHTGAFVLCHLFSNGEQSFENSIGSQGGDNEMALFIRRTGLGELLPFSLQADFLHINTHGSYDGTLRDHPDQNLIFDPADARYGIHPQSEWNQDIEWAYISACTTLTDEGMGFRAWRSALNGDPRRAHGLLGMDGINNPVRNDVQNFWLYLNPAAEHRTFLEAYKAARSPQPWAVYYHSMNATDKLDEVTPDKDEEDPERVLEDCSGTSLSMASGACGERA
jgi:hypothetical protein